MKIIKTKQLLLDFKGENMKSGDAELSVGDVISFVLGGKVSNPYLGFVLGKKFAHDDEVELKAEDLAFVKAELEKNGKSPETGFNAIVIGQVIDIIDGTEDVKKGDAKKK